MSATQTLHTHPWLTTYPHPRNHPSIIHQHSSIFIHPPAFIHPGEREQRVWAGENPEQGIREDEEERRRGRGASSRRESEPQAKDRKAKSKTQASLRLPLPHAMPCHVRLSPRLRVRVPHFSSLLALAPSPVTTAMACA